MFKTHFWRTLAFAIAGALLGLFIAMVSPKTYQADVELLLGESPVSNAQSLLDPQVQRILETGVARDAQTELQLLRSVSVFYNAFRNACENQRKVSEMRNWVDYLRIYDVISIEQRAGVLEAGSVARVQCRAYEPKFAEEIARQVADEYNNLRTTNARNSSANAKRYVQAQVVEAKKSLESAEGKYKEFTARENVIDAGITAQSRAGRENTTRLQAEQARQTYQAASARVSAIEAQIGNIPKVITTSSDQIRTYIQQLEGNLAALRSELNRAKSRYFDNHPRVKELTSSVADLESKIKEEKGKDLVRGQQSTVPNPVYQQMQGQLATERANRDGAEKSLAVAEEALSSAEAEHKKLPASEAELRNLRRELDVADANYRRVKMMLDDLNNRSDVMTRSIVILAEPRAYDQPVAPDTSKMIFIGCIAGICIGLIFSFSLESLRLRVHNSQQLAELTGLPVVATVPRLGRGQARTAGALAKAGATPGESFRHMAYTMLAKADHAGPKTIVFTAVGAASGRAASAIQFAMAMASTGKRVLLVDGDPQRSVITKAFGAEGRSGVNEIFDRSMLPGDSSDIVVPTAHTNLSIMPVGADTTRSLADRSTSQIEAFMKFAAELADLVVFDVPPCDIFSDASRLASYVDEVCMVISASNTNYQQIPAGYEILSRAGAKNVNLVLTDASPQDEPFGDTRRYLRSA